MSVVKVAGIAGGVLAAFVLGTANGFRQGHTVGSIEGAGEAFHSMIRARIDELDREWETRYPWRRRRVVR